ncbi:CRISPR-associated RAMP family protein [Actinomyces bouchesdurhonensis]|uniref:CRISPR-associated RAMP family protein n=1 Tax=Actinomyces bouchesdurhonensis TaxID=1852361 RepID=UPI003C71D490
MSNFHHAYNGIPTLRSKEEPFFRDAEPAPLDHLAPGTYSGTLKLTIETKTPLITACRDTTGRLVVPSSSGNPDGATTARDAIIPATSLKGVLSSAFEEITQSRFRVFGDHQLQEQFRYTTDHKQKFNGKNNSGWTAAFLRVKTTDNKTIWHIHPQDYALLPDSILAGVAFTPSGREDESIYGGFRGVRILDRNEQPILKNGKFQYKQNEVEIIPHTDEEINAIEELLTTVRHVTPHLSKVNSLRVFDRNFWGITIPVVSEINGKKLCISKGSADSRPKTHKLRAKAWVVRLTKLNQDHSFNTIKNRIDGKYNEFVFYEPNKLEAYSITMRCDSPFVATVLTATHNQLKQEKETSRNHTLICHVLDYIKNKFGENKLKENITLTNIYDALLELAKSEPGIPVFARKHSNRHWEILFSQLGRSISSESLPPETLASHGHVAPARSLQEASSAERLWGFVAQELDEDSTPALKGRIYLEDAHLCTDDFKRADEGGWIPPILASPKPSTAQPYLRSRTGDGIFELERSKCFTAQHSLIRKTYPTHRFLTSKGASQPSMLNDKNRELTGSEVLIGSYIMPEATLESVLRFEGLTAQEISIILWLLTPKNLVPKDEQRPREKGYFHLGLGKPLGLGTASISAEVLSLQDSQSLAVGYKDLDTVLYHNTCEDDNKEGKTISEIFQSISDALPKTIREHSSLAVLAFVRSAYGWKKDEAKHLDRDPVSYTPYPDSENKSPIIDYFTNYEQSRIIGSARHFADKMRTLEEDRPAKIPPPGPGTYRVPSR